MFCIYCRTPFDENVATVCSGCGRELFKEREDSTEPEPEEDTELEHEDNTELESEGSAESAPESGTDFMSEVDRISRPSRVMVKTKPPRGLVRTCKHCGAQFPVTCYNCSTSVANPDAVVPLEGYMVCDHCRQTFWVLCPNCRQTQEEQQPQQQPEQPQQQGWQQPQFGGGVGIPYTPQQPWQPPATPQPGAQQPHSPGSSSVTPRQGQYREPQVNYGPAGRRERYPVQQEPHEPYDPSQYYTPPGEQHGSPMPQHGPPMPQYGPPMPEKKNKIKDLLPKLIPGGAVAAALIIFLITRIGSGGGGGGGSGVSYFTPNAYINGNRMSTAWQASRNDAYMVWSDYVTHMDTKTGDTKQIVDLNKDLDVRLEAREPHFFVGDYVYFLTKNMSDNEKSHRLTRVNLKTGEVEYEDGEDEYALDILYDGTHIYAIKPGTGSSESGANRSLVKYDPGKFSPIESYELESFQIMDTMIWQGKLYYQGVYLQYEDDYVEGEARDAYMVVDLETGDVSRLLSDRKIYATQLCANNDALYYIAQFEGSPIENAVYAIKDGEPSVFFGPETHSDYYKQIPRNSEDLTVKKDEMEDGSYYYDRVQGIFIDGDWMLVHLMVEPSFQSHYLRVKTDGSEIYRVIFPEYTGGGHSGQHDTGMTGGDKDGWFYSGMLTWQFEDNEITRKEGKDLDEPVPFEKLK